MFQTLNEPSLKIGNYVISDRNFIYYANGHTIYKIDKATRKEAETLDTKYDIESIFLDSHGNLYYYGINSTQDIIKFDGKNQLVIIHDALPLKIDDEYLYFSTGNYSNIKIQRYNTKSGDIEKVKIPIPGVVTMLTMLQNKPLAFCDCEENNKSEGYLYNYKTGLVLQAYSSQEYYVIADDERSILFYNVDPLSERERTIRIYSLTNEFEPITLADPINAREGFSYTEHFICNGKELQYIQDNYMYVVDLRNGKITRSCLIRIIPGYTISCCVYNGTWYILTQKPLITMHISDVSIATAQPILYTFDIQTHMMKKLWQAESYSNSNSVNLEISIDSGYLWMFNYACPSLDFWKRLLLSELRR